MIGAHNSHYNKCTKATDVATISKVIMIGADNSHYNKCAKATNVTTIFLIWLNTSELCPFWMEMQQQDNWSNSEFSGLGQIKIQQLMILGKA
jgi:hypothetical protein